MKRKSILLLFLVFFVLINPLKAQDYNNHLNGYVKDETNGETLIGATVFIQGTKKGSYTNKAGFYSITNIKPGTYTVKVTSIGFKPIEKEIKIEKDNDKRLDIELSSASVQTQEVFVEAEREIDKRQITVSKVDVPIAQIKQIRIGGESDVFRTIQMLPGVLTSSQISSGLYIRGGSPDQNLVLLDGSTVYNPSHLFGFISSFNSDAIKDVELIKGGYPAEFGSRMSSVINITQKDGNRKEFEGLANIGAISSKLALEGPLLNGSWFLSGRRTYFELIKAVLPVDEENPLPDFGFYDLNGKITQDLGPNDKIAFSGFLSNDNFSIGNTGIEVDLFLGNQAGSAKWTHIFSGNLFTNLNFTASRYNNGFGQEFSGFKVKVENSINDYSLKGNLEWFASEEATFKSGFEFQNYKFHYEQNFTGSDTTVSDVNEGGLLDLIIHDWTYSGYVQGNYQFSPLFSAQAGLRVNYWDLSDEINFDPRLALRYQLFEDVSLEASWGIFHQYLRLAADENISLFDTWLPTDNTVDPSMATHYILSIETSPFKDYEFNFDVYYKELENISEVKRNNIDGNNVDDIFFTGDGEAYGGEIFLQKRVGEFTGWIGYGLGWVTARFDSINFGREFRPKYDRRHDFKVVAQYKLNDRWTLGSTFMFQSGQSYTGATSRYQITMPDQNYGVGRVFPSQRYGLRMPPSHQLNLNAVYNTSVFGLDSKLIIDIYNVYSRRDILLRFYDTAEKEASLEEVLLLPIIPTVSFEVKF
jgi:hypothetical protein